MSRYLLVDSGQTLASSYDLLGSPLPKDVIVVAATSSGMAACEQAGVAYTSIDQFSSRKEIIELGWSNYSGLTSFCEHWDILAQQLLPCLRERNIKPFRFGYYDLKILIDSITVKILLLKNFINEVGSQEIYFAQDRSCDIASGESLIPDENRNIYSILLEGLFKQVPQLKPLSLAKRDGTALFSKAYVFIYSLAKTIRDSLRNYFLRQDAKHERSFLLFNSGHDIGYILPVLKEHGFHPIYVLPAPVNVDTDTREACSRLWSTLRDSSDFMNFFSYGGLGYFSLLERTLEEYIGSVLPKAIASYDQMQQSLTKHRPFFSLTGTINVGLIERCRMLAAQFYGAPLVTYTEGAGYGSIISPIYDYTEICDGDLMLCYGEGNVEYYKDLARPTKPIVPVGSAHQEAVRKKHKARMPSSSIRTVMYVGTVVSDNVLHLPNNGLISTIYCATQLKLFRLLASLPGDLRIIVKPNPSDAFSINILRLPEFQTLQLESGRFEEVLDGVDLFIIDYPSTVLLSAISTNAYVFVLIEEGVAGLTQKQRDRLDLRAYVFDEFDDFVKSILDIVSDIDLFPPKLNEDYMLAYSLYEKDGRACARATDAIENFFRC